MQNRSIVIFAGLLAATLALADGAWKWTDDNGVVHYSDVPVEGAQAVNISEYTHNTGARIAPNTTPATSGNEPPPPQAAFRYENISISSPGAEETLWNIEGVLSVNVSVTPALQSGHRVRAYFDGQERLVEGTNFTINEVYRGVHNLQVEIIDNTGRLMIRSQPNRFYVQQNLVKR
jgi:Domain of unknown function (DUF4124)